MAVLAPAAEEPLEQHLPRHVEGHGRMGGDAEVEGDRVGRLGLGQRARIPVEEVATEIAHGLQHLVTHDGGDDVVGDEVPSLEVRLHPPPHLRSRRHRGAEQRPRRHVWHPELGADDGGLGPLARPGRSDEERAQSGQSRSTIALANSDVLTAVAPSMSRAKS